MITRGKGEVDKLPKHPRMTPKLVEAINELLYVPNAETVKGKLVQVLGTPLTISGIVEQLASMPLIDTAGVLISGGSAPAYKSVWHPEFHACNIAATWIKFQNGKNIGIFHDIFGPIFSKKIREELRRPESVRIYEGFKERYSAYASKVPFILEGKSTNTYKNFTEPLGNGTYDRFFEALDATREHRDCCGYAEGLVLVTAEQSALRAKLTAQTILGAVTNVENISYKEVDSIYRPGMVWSDFAAGRSWVWGEVLRIVKYSDWGKMGKPGGINISGEKEFQLERVLSYGRLHGR